jgi:uncharacterized protein (DUF2336 family)
MRLGGQLLAAIAPCGDVAFLAAVVDPAAAPDGLSTKRLCASRREARQWIEDQAETSGRPIQWVSEGVMGLMS